MEKSRGAFQDMDQLAIFKPVTKWAEQVTDVRRIPEMVSKAVRMAFLGQPGPVYLDLPGDILYAGVRAEEVYFPENSKRKHRSSGDTGSIEKAIDLLKNARRPILLTGSGAQLSNLAGYLETGLQAEVILADPLSRVQVVPAVQAVIEADRMGCAPAVGLAMRGDVA